MYSYMWRNNQLSTMLVYGMAEMKVEPNLAIVSVGVVTEGDEINEVQHENAVQTRRIIQAMQALGISEDHIQSISYTVEPQYEYVDGKKDFLGYKVRHVLQITVKNTEVIGDVLRTAIEKGATEEYGVTFKNTNYESYYRQALQQALKNAKQKAIAMAETLQVTLMNVPRKVEEESSNQRPVPYESVKLASAGSGPPIQTGLITVEARVTVKYEYV